MIFDGELNKHDVLKFQVEGMYGILVDNSDIQIQYSRCIKGRAYSSTFRNSKNQYICCSGNSLLFEDVIWLNSIVNKDEESEKNILRQPSFYKTNLIQQGSYIEIKSPININTNSISGNGGIVDQDFFFSGYLINDGDKLFWSTLSNTKDYNNIGQFYKNSSINIMIDDFKNLLKIIPKNLNGYNVTFTIADNKLLDENEYIEISDFYNGIIYIYNLKSTNSLICNNNNAEINIINSNISGNSTSILKCTNNNKLNFSNTTLGRNDNIEYPLLFGYGNNIYFDHTVSYSSISKVFNMNRNNDISTINNNLIFESTSTVSTIINALTGQYDSLVSANSNLIQIKDLDIPQTSANSDLLFNHTHKYLYNNISSYTDNTLSINSNFYLTGNAVTNSMPLAYGGVEIGSIIGWRQYLVNNTWLPKLPNGFYNCSIAKDNPLNSFEIPIDVANPTDKFFNGQLAELLGAKITDITFNIPNIPAIIGEKLNTNRMIYIIKYNNNVEHNQTTGTIFEI